MRDDPEAVCHLEGINCTPETYGSECTRLNRQYGKNNASYAAATPDEEGIGQHDYQSNNDSDHTVVTNPPYMAVSNADAKVNDYVKKNFPYSKADLFAVFIERCGQMATSSITWASTQWAW